MSKIIRMTPEIIERLRGTNLINGKLSFADVSKEADQKAVVWYTPDAYAKQIALIMDSDKEVAWHGVVRRKDDAPGEYVISDILVYPQTVTGATVNTDQVEYNTWMMNLDDDTFNDLKMQGHSHVNMPTNPSGTDEEHQAKIVEQLEDDMFYIFMIWNKQFKYTARIYDMRLNTMFEPNEVDVMMVGASSGLVNFLKDARAMVKPRTYNYQNTYQNQNSQAVKTAASTQNIPDTTKPAVTAPAATTAPTQKDSKKDATGTDVPSRPKTCIGNGWSGAANHQNDYPDYGDYDSPHYGRYH